MSPLINASEAQLSLAEELCARLRADQEARRVEQELRKQNPDSEEAVAAGYAMGRVDRENTTWLKRQIEEQGWPRISEVGPEAATAAWMIAQHAAHDLHFQRLVLNAMEALLPEGEVKACDVALLTDRVLLAEGKRQRYGSQCTFDADGGWVCLPCEDPERLNERRASVGLGTIETYLLEIARTFG